MAVTTTKTNKPINPRGNDQSPKGYNRASLFSGKALDFDGVNDILDLSSTITLTDFSLCAYIDKSSVETAGIFSNSDGTDAIMFRSTSANDFRIRINSNNNNISLDDDGVYDDGLNFWVFIREDANFYIYKNGHKVAESSSVQTNDFEVSKIGAQGTTNFLESAVSGARVFNQVLTAAQVADLYNNPEKIVPTGVEDTALKLWLPMMEGAGTTAYDGSGNGNHGTISGATWTHGVGAPVAQSAVIDWNKAKNDAGRSQEFDNAYWGKGGLIVTANATTAPDGTQTADKLAAISTANSNAEIYRAIGFTANNAASVFVKSDTAQWVTLGTNRTLGRVVFFDIINGVVGTESTGYTGAITEYPNGWYKLDVYWDGTATTQTYWDLSIADADNAFGVTAGKSIFAWGAYANKSGTTIGPYIATLTDSAITSDVLLPEGLTSGRDITGVNLFENVRKQGALNLDGNSWAEVHDNASIDLSDANASFEAWVYYDFTATSNNYIFNKLVSAGYRIRIEPGGNFGFYASDGTTAFSDGGSFPLVADSWNHLVLTTDGTNFKRYINGSLADTDISGTALTSYANTDNLYIGSNQTPGDYMPTQIAQPRIYNRALTAEEVQRNYDAGKNIYS